VQPFGSDDTYGQPFTMPLQVLDLQDHACHMDTAWKYIDTCLLNVNLEVAQLRAVFAFPTNGHKNGPG
jgi:hypothetical protein